MDAELRRGPLRPRTDPASGAEGEGGDGGDDPVLVERLRAEIERDGPVTFARFMEVALYDPERGYYRTEPDRPTREGDFLTAPEMHPIFGRTLARQLAECWERLGRPDPFTVVEHGAGSGALILSMVDGWRRNGTGLLEALRYVPIEVNAHRRTQLLERLAAAGMGGIVVAAAPGRAGVAVANELLDALPVHRVVGRDGGLREIRVGWSDRGFTDVELEPSTPELAGRLETLGVRLEDGQQAEVCLEIATWLDGAVEWLDPGYLVVIDYGLPARELYAPSRRTGTLLAYRSHAVSEDLYASVGRQDLTAHVDLTTLSALAEERGLATLGVTSQAAFLVGAGIERELQAVQADPGTTLEDYLVARSAVRRLLDPKALGGFSVAVFGRNVEPEPPLSGLARPASAG